ncbi:MAG: DUF5667 domain-containing protein, partial [Dehalococcoidia bacterium]
VAVAVGALLAAGGATVYASQRSLPDDALYPVKIGVENLQLAFTPGPGSRASLHLKLAQRRTGEVVAQSRRQRDLSPSALGAVAAQIDAAIREIGKIPPEDALAYLSRLSRSTLDQQARLGSVLEASPEAGQPALRQALAATRRGTLIGRVAYGNPALLYTLPSVLDEGIEAGHFQLEGTLLGAEGGTWNLGGLLMENVNSYQEAPPPGSRVEIEGIVRGDEIFIGKIELEIGESDRVKVEGIFGGDSPDGAVWFIGGIPVLTPQGVAPPPVGERVELEGAVRGGMFIVSGLESERNGEGELAVAGSILRVDPGQGTVAIEIAANEVVINLSGAEITDSEGQPLTLSDLESLAAPGQDIKVEKLSEKGGLLFAGEAYVDIEQDSDDGEEDDDGGGQSGGEADSPDGDSDDGEADSPEEDSDDGEADSPDEGSDDGEADSPDGDSGDGEADSPDEGSDDGQVDGAGEVRGGAQWSEVHEASDETGADGADDADDDDEDAEDDEDDGDDGDDDEDEDDGDDEDDEGDDEDDGDD